MYSGGFIAHFCFKQDLNQTLVKWHKDSRRYVVVSISTVVRNLWEGAEENLAAGVEGLPLQTLWRGSPRKENEESDQTGSIHYFGWLEHNDMNDILGNYIIFAHVVREIFPGILAHAINA